MSIQDRLRSARLMAGISQVDMASMLHIHLKTYASWELGLRNLSNSNAARCALLLKVSPYWLIHGDPALAVANDAIDLLNRIDCHEDAAEVEAELNKIRSKMHSLRMLSLAPTGGG